MLFMILRNKRDKWKLCNTLFYALKKTQIKSSATLFFTCNIIGQQIKEKIDT